MFIAGDTSRKVGKMALDIRKEPNSPDLFSLTCDVPECGKLFEFQDEEYGQLHHWTNGEELIEFARSEGWRVGQRTVSCDNCHQYE